MSARPPAPAKILVFAHDAALGGAQRSLLEILERLDPAAYRPVVVVPTPGPFVEAVRQRGFTCRWGLTQRWLFFKKPLSLRLLVKKPWRLLTHPYLWAVLSLATLPVRLALLARLAKKEGAALLYSNTVTLLDGALLARLLGLPHVWHVREPAAGNPDLASPFPLAWLPRFILRGSDCVIVNSAALRNTLFGNGAHARVRLIHNGIALDAPPPSPPDLAPIPAGARLTAICGGLHPRKGVHVYLAALARLRDSHPEAHHLVIGGGQAEYATALRREAERLGLAARVHFLGDRADVRALLSRCEILVSASLHESFGRTLIEAMALGVPVVATKSGGPEEIIEDGESGFLVATGDADALAERMSRLLSDRALATTMGQAGRERVERCFDIRKTVAGIEKVFSEVLHKA